MGFLVVDCVNSFYSSYKSSVSKIKKQLSRPLTLTEKIIFSHLSEGEHMIERGSSTIKLNVDRLAMQDATAQMAILQFMTTNISKTRIPTSIHCDHLIRARHGKDADLHNALLKNNEVYAFLQSSSNKFGMEFWRPGSGIMHQVMFENYVMPGNLIIGTDSHTMTIGGLSSIGMGIGASVAVDAMINKKISITIPKITGIHLKGKMPKWTCAKDVILNIIGVIGMRGAKGRIIEYFGEGCKHISISGRATITNMGAETGATSSIFPYDDKSSAFLRATERFNVAEICDKIKKELNTDEEILENPYDYYDEVIEIDLSQIEPQIAGPGEPGLVRPINKFGRELQQNEWPKDLSAALIGSCTNSSYEDYSKVASLAKQAVKRGLKVKIPLYITPGSKQVHQTLERDGTINLFKKLGATILASACGPCIGLWSRDDISRGEKTSIITSYSRNICRRNDHNPETHTFLASPEMVLAFALSGNLNYNPLTDSIEDNNSNHFWLKEPKGHAIPKKGFVFDEKKHSLPTNSGEIIILPNSERVSLFQPFSKWNFMEDFKDLFVLLKSRGRCTADQISPVGRWLFYRGHLDNVCNSIFNRTTNFYTNEIGLGKNLLTGENRLRFSTIARSYKHSGKGWIIVAEHNYGEGSSRDHSAMAPRHLGCRAVIAKCFARVAEENLKRHGILALTFSNKGDFRKIKQDDIISIAKDQLQLISQKPIMVKIKHSNGGAEIIETKHNFTPEEIAWFNAGSALNWIIGNY